LARTPADAGAVRCFIALGTDGAEREALRDWLDRALEAPELAVTPAENLHVTLAFLGPQPPHAVADAEEAVRAAVADAPGAWPLAWDAPGVFPSRSRPRVLWLGVASDGRLGKLHEALTRELGARRLPTEERAFHPHLTLARLRRGNVSPARLRELVALLEAVPLPAPTAVRSVVLYRSLLGRGPARHVPLLEVALPADGWPRRPPPL